MKLGYGLWALICLSILNKGVGTKAMVHAPLFPVGEISLPLLEKDRTLDLLVVGNGGTVNYCVCPNEFIIEGFFIFGTTFNVVFLGFRLVWSFRCVCMA